MPKCLRCGHEYKNRGKNKYVQSCGKCTKKFSNVQLRKIYKGFKL